MMKKNGGEGRFSSRRIDARIEELDNWRGAMLARLRALILEADPRRWRSGSGRTRCGRTRG